MVILLLACIEPEPCEPVDEVCNARDDDCDGVVDEGSQPGDGMPRLPVRQSWEDRDGDGYGAGDPRYTCEEAVYIPWEAELGGDCDDNDYRINPGDLAICVSDTDWNCNGVVTGQCPEEQVDPEDELDFFGEHATYGFSVSTQEHVRPSTWRDQPAIWIAQEDAAHLMTLSSVAPAVTVTFSSGFELKDIETNGVWTVMGLDGGFAVLDVSQASVGFEVPKDDLVRGDGNFGESVLMLDGDLVVGQHGDGLLHRLETAGFTTTSTLSDDSRLGQHTLALDLDDDGVDDLVALGDNAVWLVQGPVPDQTVPIADIGDTLTGLEYKPRLFEWGDGFLIHDNDDVVYLVEGLVSGQVSSLPTARDDGDDFAVGDGGDFDGDGHRDLWIGQHPGEYPDPVGLMYGPITGNADIVLDTAWASDLNDYVAGFALDDQFALWAASGDSSYLLMY